MNCVTVLSGAVHMYDIQYIAYVCWLLCNLVCALHKSFLLFVFFGSSSSSSSVAGVNHKLNSGSHTARMCLKQMFPLYFFLCLFAACCWTPYHSASRWSIDPFETCTHTLSRIQKIYNNTRIDYDYRILEC